MIAFLRKHLNTVLLANVICCIFLFTASCNKMDLDLNDPTVYKWEVTETWASTMPNYDQGDIKIDHGGKKTVVKVDIRMLSNSQVKELMDKDKKDGSYQLKFKKLN